MNWRWLISRTVRHAGQLRKQVWKLLNAQRDLLSPQAIKAVEDAMVALRQKALAGADAKALLQEMETLEKVATKWLKPYPSASMRENVEVLLVALAVAMAIRTFFVQPFKIPTGSMQPTLYGVTSVPDFKNSMFPALPASAANFEVPNAFKRFFLFWWSGVQYMQWVAPRDGRIIKASPPVSLFLFNLKQTFYFGTDEYDAKPVTIWFPPDDMLQRAGLVDRHYMNCNPKQFKKNEEVLKLKSFAGDHLFVDRLTYNFRRPRRGEVIVFETQQTDRDGRLQIQYYIKRMVAMGNERVQIGDDRHLVIDGKRLDASTPHFDRIYSFSGPPQDSHYSGHLNDTVAQQYGLHGLAPLFPNASTVFQLKPNHYMVMGDNTVNSSDSRSWGEFPRDKVIGKSFFVYWPFGSQDDRPSRFGTEHLAH
jgi:signal peptidase I